MNILFKAIKQANLNASNTPGSINFTDENNIYLVDSKNSKIKFTDVFNVDNYSVLTSMKKIKDKIYILNNGNAYFYDGTNLKPLINEKDPNLDIVQPAYSAKLYYDENDNVIKEVYTGGVEKTITYEYNEDGYITTKNVTVNDVTKTCTYKYNDKGLLVQTIDEGTDLIYASTGNNKGDLSSKSFNIDCQYDSNDNLIKETYTGEIQRVVNYTYDDVITNRLLEKSVTENGETVKAKYTYNEKGDLTGVTDGGTELLKFEGEYAGSSDFLQVKQDIIGINQKIEEKTEFKSLPRF